MWPLGFRVQDLGFRILGFRILGFGILGFWMLGFRIEGVWGSSIFGVGGVGLKAGVVDLLRSNPC